jgi:hypothetical protein
VEAFHRARARRRRDAWLTVAFALAAAAAALVAFGIARDRLILLPAAVVLALLAWKYRPRPDPERWLRGAAGEMATARVLARLPGRRWAVLHDRRVPGSRANLDHVVIGPTGVWLVDSKTTRARVRAGWRSVHIGDRRMDTGATRWEADVLADRLGTDVRALVVLHADGLRRRGVRCAGIRVVPPDGLLRRIRRGRRQLTAERVAELATRTDAVFMPAASAFEKGPGLYG